MTSDVLWLRNNDGSPGYSFTVPQGSGDIIGTPYWDTVNETTAKSDANGDGDQLDTDVRVVYLATNLGHIIKLVDNGSSLAQPAAGPWKTDFTNASISTITSPLTLDGTNLYFGGTSSGTPKVFGVQIIGPTNEATLQKTVGSVSTVTTEPSWMVFGGSTYVFLGSTATAGTAYIYRINMTSATVASSFTATANVNGPIVLIGGRVYAATDGGTLHMLDGVLTDAGGFKNFSGYPYQTAAAKPIKFAPTVDNWGEGAYFGDDGGNVYYLPKVGGLATGYPLNISASIKITSTPMYLKNGGVIAVGASDGYVYFIDRNNGSGPSLFKRFFVSGSGSISSVSYDQKISAYMVSSSDGKLIFINGADVTDPTPTKI
jgi:hypothetical protein